MVLDLVMLPLAPADLRRLADAGYTLVDQALRTPGLLIVQGPADAPAVAHTRAPSVARADHEHEHDHGADHDEDHDEDHAPSAPPRRGAGEETGHAPV